MEIDHFDPFGEYVATDPLLFENVENERRLTVITNLVDSRIATDTAYSAYANAVETRNALARLMRDSGFTNRELAAVLGITEQAVSQLYHAEEPVVSPCGATALDKMAKCRQQAYRNAVLRARATMQRAHRNAWWEVRERARLGTLTQPRRESPDEREEFLEQAMATVFNRPGEFEEETDERNERRWNEAQLAYSTAAAKRHNETHGKAV